MPPKSKGSSKGPKQRTVRCRDDELLPGSCARGAHCRFLHEESSNPSAAGGGALSLSQSSAPEPFGFGKLDLERYREAALRISKQRMAGSSSIQSLQNQLKELWEATVGNLFPSNACSAMSLFQHRIDLGKLGTKPAEWPNCFGSQLQDASFTEQALSQLILQRDFAIGLQGASASSYPGLLNFLAVDPTFLQHVRASLASSVLCPHQPNSCLPHLIRNLIKSEPIFLEIMLQILPSHEDDHDSAEPLRIKQGAQLCHILQHTFGFDIQDVKPLYLRLLTNPMSSSSNQNHLGEWRAVDESPPQRYSLRGEPLGVITKYCVDDEENEGCTCMHRRLGPDREVLRRPHWSCCGGLTKSDLFCVNSNSASKFGGVGFQCSLAHPLSVRVCLPWDLPIDAICARCGLDCQSLSCVDFLCAVCNQSFCLPCSELMSKNSSSGLKELQPERPGGSSGAEGRAAGGGGVAQKAAKEVQATSDGTVAGVSSLTSLMYPTVASFVNDCHTGASWSLVTILCDIIDKKQMRSLDIHTIRMLLLSLNMNSPIFDEEPFFSQNCCRSLAGAMAAVLARQHPSLLPDRELPLDLRVQHDLPTKIGAEVASSSAPYLQPILELIQKTKRFNEFSQPLLLKIHEDYPTPAELISLIEQKQRLLVALEVAYFKLKHPAVSKSKGDMLKDLLEMGCFPRKFAVKAVLKSSRVEDAVNFFFSESKTASDEDESEDAVLSSSTEACEALKLLVSVPPVSPQDSSDERSGSKLPDISEIEANTDCAQLLAIISSACSSLGLFKDLKEITDPIMKSLYDRVESIAHQQKVTPKSHHASELDRRLLFQSLTQSCTHLHFVESLHCSAGHPLVQRPCDQQTRCAHCSSQISSGNLHFSCANQKPSSSSTKRCDWSMCMPCAREQFLVQSAFYSPFDIATCTQALERLIPHDKMQESMICAFSAVAGSAELAVAPIVPFRWLSPEIPRPQAKSGDICGPDCTTAHSDDGSICIRCDRAYSRHKKEHLCNDGQRGYFIATESSAEGQSPVIEDSPSCQQIHMHHSSARPVSLVHSEPGMFSGRKWTCTLVNTGERGQNTWIGLCDAKVVAEYSGTKNFQGLGTKGKGFSIGFHPQLGVRVDDKVTSREFTRKDGEGITIEYDEPGRKLDVIIAKKVVYTHAGLPPNLTFAISSGDKKSKFNAVRCRQVDVPLSLDADRAFLLERISKAISDSEYRDSEKVFSLLSLLSTFRAKPHHVLMAKFLRPSQETLVRIISEFIDSDDLNAITSRAGACAAIFSELAHITDWNRKPLLLACVVQLKRISVALLQGRNTHSLDSLGFISKLYAVCSKGFAYTTASAFDYLIKHLTLAGSSKSNVEYVRIPRWVIEAIDPSRSFMSLYDMFGACFPAMLHAGWVDVETRDGKSVRLSCEAAQVLMNQCAARDNCGSLAHALTTGRVAASINNELSTNGLLQDLHIDCDIVQTPLQTASLPMSIHIGSSCIEAVSWFKARLYTQDRLDEIEALAACCKDTGSPPAIVQSVLTDLIRRSFVVRKDGFIMLASALGPPSVQHQTQQLVLVDQKLKEEAIKEAVSEGTQVPGAGNGPMPHAGIFTKQPVFGPLPQHDLFKVSHAVFFTIDDSAVVPSPWTSSISSAASISIRDFEIDLADTLYGLQNLEHCDDVLKTARIFEECSGSVTAFVFTHNHDGAPSSTPAIVKSSGSCPICFEDDAELVLSPCGHLACSSCYHHLLHTAISDSGSPVLAKGDGNLLSITSIKCMTLGCQEHLPLSFLQQVVPDLADVTKRILVRTLLRILNNSTCPISSCLCGQSMLIGNSQDCEAICGQCGRCATIGDFKRKEIPESWIPHATISSDEVLNWNMLNDVGNSSRRDLMRFKGCPHCGTMTTRCGCSPQKIECDNLERCPNEKCDHIDCTVCSKRWCWVCGGPSCPTKCAKPALERTHRKEKFLLSQNAIVSLSKTSLRYPSEQFMPSRPHISHSFRIDEQHIFLRARSQFLKLFYRGPDAFAAADPAASTQLIQAAVAQRDFDTVRFLLFIQMSQKSKKHFALLWLAFAHLTGDFDIILPFITRCFSRCHRVAHLESSQGERFLASDHDCAV